MSRLDSFIRRLQAQRDCLAECARLVDGVPGPVLEFGLGNGRTYDHLRTLFPDREIFVFDRRIAAHPDCVPDAAHMLLGDFDDTMPSAGARIGAPAALAHFDVGSPDPASNGALAERLVALAAPLLAPGGVVVSDLELPAPAWSALALPDGIRDGRYFMYRVGGTG